MNTENEIASAILTAAKLLGNGNACTEMGAIEALGTVHKEGMADIADALRDIASAIGYFNDARIDLIDHRVDVALAELEKLKLDKK
jgi:hypothetical protein